MKPGRFFLIPFLLTAPAAPAAGEDAAALAKQVHAIFSAQCGACHKADSPEHKQPHFLNDYALLKDYLDLAKPEESELYGMLQRVEMPKATKAQKLKGETAKALDAPQLATVLAWVRAGAPAPKAGGAAAAAAVSGEKPKEETRETAPSAAAPAEKRKETTEEVKEKTAPAVPAPVEKPVVAAAPRALVTEAQVAADALRDLLSLPAEERAGTRYLSLHPQQNNWRELTPEALTQSRGAARKLLNSLSLNPQIAKFPQAGTEGVLLRVRLRDLGPNWSAALWDRITATYPYALDGQALQGLAGPAGCAVPVVRADWFAATASLPPLYDEILNHPENVRDLEKRLGVDVNGNLAAGEALRAAFTKSGISNQNRMVERHEIGTYAGAFWMSYDFKTNLGRGRVMDFPLGPENADLLGGKLAFTHDGGEVIYNLPNGLQAYLLVDGAGKKINSAPVEVVSDRSASRKTSHSQISNGLSCIACHDTGMQPLPPDEVRPLAGTHGAAEQRLIELLYAPAAKSEAVTAADRKRFLEAVTQAEGAPGAVREPVQALVNQFEKDVTLAQAAAELGLEPDALQKSLEGSPALFSTKVQLTSGRIPRVNFPDHFSQVAVRLGLGAPRDFAPQPKVLTAIRDPFGVKRDRAAAISVELTLNATVFHEGDLLEATVRTSEDAHLRLFCRTPSGQLITLFPNEFSLAQKKSTLIKANQPVTVPDAAANFDLPTEAPFGEETLIAVVSNQEFTDDSELVASVTKSVKSGKLAGYGTNDAEAAITKSFRARAKGARVGVARVKVITKPGPNPKK